MKKINETKEVHTMTVEELERENIDYLSRLACLLYGVNVAGEAAAKMGRNTERDSSWIKPIFFQKYIDERYGDMKYNITKSLNGGDDEVYSW